MMQGLRAQILDFTALAEAPCYSVLAWAKDEAGSAATMEMILAVIGDLVQDDILQLWEIDAVSGDRTELYSLPGNLLDRYQEVHHSDPTYDPFCLSLSVPRDSQIATEWDFDVDLRRGLFELRSGPDKVELAWHRLVAYFPDIDFREQRRTLRDGQLLLEGLARPRRSC